MNLSHVHLVLNHFPIAGIMLGFILLLIYLLIKNQTVLNISLITFIITGIVTILTFTTGEGAEEVIENIPGIEESRIEKHEELAEKSLVLTEAIATLALFTFFIYFKKKKIHKLLLFVMLILSAGTSVLLMNVNNTGGEIRHTEIRKEQGNNPSNVKEEK